MNLPIWHFKHKHVVPSDITNAEWLKILSKYREEEGEVESFVPCVSGLGFRLWTYAERLVQTQGRGPTCCTRRVQR